MVLTNTISKQGGKVQRIRVTGTVTGDKATRAQSGVLEPEASSRARGNRQERLSELAKNAEKAAPSPTRSGGTFRFQSTLRLPDHRCAVISIALLVASLCAGRRTAQSLSDVSAPTRSIAP